MAAANQDLGALVDQIKSYRSEAKTRLDQCKMDLASIIKQSLSPDSSSVAISNMLYELNRVESSLFDLSILKMELKSVLDRLPENTGMSNVRIEARASLNYVGECCVIIQKRYEHVSTVLTGIRSINSNMRTHFKANLTPSQLEDVSVLRVIE